MFGSKIEIIFESKYKNSCLLLTPKTMYYSPIEILMLIIKKFDYKILKLCRTNKTQSKPDLKHWHNFVWFWSMQDG